MFNKKFFFNSKFVIERMIWYRNLNSVLKKYHVFISLWSFIPDSGSDPESGIPAGISGDKFSGTEQNRNSGNLSIPAPDIRLSGYPAQPYILTLVFLLC